MPLEKEKKSAIAREESDQLTEINWQVPEYHQYQRPTAWYYLAAAAGGGLIVFALLSNNFLLAVLVVLAAIVIILNDRNEPNIIKVSLNYEGLRLGRKFYDFDELKNFSVVYKPRDGIKNLYCERKNGFLPRLSIPLEQKNPLTVRKFLLQYLPEDLERTHEPLSESLAKLFKL